MWRANYPDRMQSSACYIRYCFDSSFFRQKNLLSCGLKGLNCQAQPIESLLERIAVIQGTATNPIREVAISDTAGGGHPAPSESLSSCKSSSTDDEGDDDSDQTQAIDLQQLLNLCRPPSSQLAATNSSAFPPQPITRSIDSSFPRSSFDISSKRETVQDTLPHEKFSQKDTIPAASSSEVEEPSSESDDPCEQEKEKEEDEDSDEETEKLPLSVLLASLSKDPAVSSVNKNKSHAIEPAVENKENVFIEGRFSSSVASSIAKELVATASSSSSTSAPSVLPAASSLPSFSLVRSFSQPAKPSVPHDAQQPGLLAADNNKRKRVSFAGNDLPQPVNISRMVSNSQPVASSPNKKMKKAALPVTAPEEKEAGSGSGLGLGLGLGPILEDESRRIVLNGKGYIRLGLMGKGGSSSVYRILSQQDGQVYALKQVHCGALCSKASSSSSSSSLMDGEESLEEESDELFDSYSNEIKLLQSLSGCPHIISLIDHHLSRSSRTVSLILEAGEGDLARLLSQHTSRSQLLDPLLSRLLWRDMLLAVQHIHGHRIVHGDLKPANFVFVRGRLKLIDFGIAKSFSNDTTNIYRDAQIGTVIFLLILAY